jgi:hypothetical protein
MSISIFLLVATAQSTRWNDRGKVLGMLIDVARDLASRLFRSNLDEPIAPSTAKELEPPGGFARLGRNLAFDVIT